MGRRRLTSTIGNYGAAKISIYRDRTVAGLAAVQMLLFAALRKQPINNNNRVDTCIPGRSRYICSYEIAPQLPGPL